MIGLIIVVIVALEHFIFGIIEMFGGTKLQSRAFGFEQQELENKLLQNALANQGIYNIGFSLLILAFISISINLTSLIFMMLFVVLVGTYGAITVSKKIFIVQVLPAIVAIFFLWLKL